MAAYVDVLGNPSTRPEGVPLIWRASCYPIAVREGRILLVEPAWAKRWELPGGGVELEREETLTEAAIRECREETGYRFVPDPPSLRFAGEHFFSVPWSGNFYHSLTFMVRGTVEGDQVPGWIADPEEIVDIQWLDPSTLTEDRVQWFHWSTLRSLGLVNQSAIRENTRVSGDCRARSCIVPVRLCSTMCDTPYRIRLNRDGPLGGLWAWPGRTQTRSPRSGAVARGGCYGRLLDHRHAGSRSFPVDPGPPLRLLVGAAALRCIHPDSV